MNEATVQRTDGRRWSSEEEEEEEEDIAAAAATKVWVFVSEWVRVVNIEICVRRMHIYIMTLIYLITLHSINYQALLHCIAILLAIFICICICICISFFRNNQVIILYMYIHPWSRTTLLITSMYTIYYNIYTNSYIYMCTSIHHELALQIWYICTLWLNTIYMQHAYIYACMHMHVYTFMAKL